jgi:acetyl esterase/lipase
VPDDAHTLLRTAPAGLHLTIRPAARPGTAPVVLVLPGGGYQVHADHEAEPVAEWLASLGVHAVVLRYDVTGDPVQSAERDARAALAWLRSDSTTTWATRDRLGVLGFSAGGHLAGLLATGDSPPDLAVLCYPLTSFLTEPERIEEVLGMTIEPDRRRRLTLARRIGPHSSPLFVWHAADDPVVPVSQAVELTDAAVRAGVPVELHVFERGGHGTGLATGRPAGAWTDLCRAWLAGRGWTNEAGA